MSCNRLFLQIFLRAAGERKKPRKHNVMVPVQSFQNIVQVLYLYTYCVCDVLGRFLEYLWACVTHLLLKRLLNLKVTRKRLSCEKMRKEQKIRPWLVAASFTRLKSSSPLMHSPFSSKVSALHLQTALTHVLRGGHRMVAQAGERTRALVLLFQMGWGDLHTTLMVPSNGQHLNICSSFNQGFFFWWFFKILFL